MSSHPCKSSNGHALHACSIMASTKLLDSSLGRSAWLPFFCQVCIGKQGRVLTNGDTLTIA